MFQMGKLPRFLAEFAQHDDKGKISGDGFWDDIFKKHRVSR